MTTSQNLTESPAPILRWAGGKTRIVHFLRPLVPALDSGCTYVEPFLGGGALFFALKPKSAILGDSNSELINCYRQVANHPGEIVRLLSMHRRNHSKKYYYSLRQLTTGNAVERAARFLYINKTAFNGIYRVNKRGIFNVPFGPSQSGPAIPSRDRLYSSSKILRQATFVVADFQHTASQAKEGDFVYLDPPYPPLRDSANFTHYTADRFGHEDQVRVAETFKQLHSRGCRVMLSNSDVKAIRALYRGFHFTTLEVTRWLGSNGDRFKVNEVVITNYNPSELQH
jgi:DNA adenine methylase